MQEEKHMHFHTRRLVIRPMHIADAPSLFGYRSNKEINRYQGWIPETPEDAVQFIRERISPQLNIRGTWYQLTLLDTKTQEMVGDVGIHFPETEPRQVELGCTLNPLFHGKGYATEALVPIISYIFNELGKDRAIALIDARNAPSVKLIERLGFQKKAHIKDKHDKNDAPLDELVYAIKRDEWKIRLAP